jgi:hypothetical protein
MQWRASSAGEDGGERGGMRVARAMAMAMAMGASLADQQRSSLLPRDGLSLARPSLRFFSSLLPLLPCEGKKGSITKMRNLV